MVKSTFTWFLQYLTTYADSPRSFSTLMSFTADNKRKTGPPYRANRDIFLTIYDGTHDAQAVDLLL